MIRRYKNTGALLGEISIRDEALTEFIQRNEEVAKSDQVGGKTDLFGIVNGFFVTEGNFYVFLYGENVRPRIAEFDQSGKLEAIYDITDSVENEIFVDFVVHGKGAEKTFFVLEGFPEARVDIFRIVRSNN